MTVVLESEIVDDSLMPENHRIDDEARFKTRLSIMRFNTTLNPIIHNSLCFSYERTKERSDERRTDGRTDGRTDKRPKR